MRAFHPPPYVRICWNSLSPTTRCPPHQFRTRNDLNKAQRTRSKANENTAKSMKAIDLLPLITVWLLVEGVPHTSGDRSPSILTSLFYPAALKPLLLRTLERRVIASLLDGLFSAQPSRKFLWSTANCGRPAEIIMSTQQLHRDNSNENADDLQQRSGREHSIEERHNAAFSAGDRVGFQA